MSISQKKNTEERRIEYVAQRTSEKSLGEKGLSMMEVAGGVQQGGKQKTEMKEVEKEGEKN